MSNSESLPVLLDSVETYIKNPKVGLPQEVFFFISKLTPLVNVDVFIKNEKKQTLLTWRHDQFYRGWHIPGGILRFKEPAADRLNAVAKGELGVTISFEAEPISIHEKIAPDEPIRGHFISLLYRCQLTSGLPESMRCLNPSSPQVNQWMWHDRCPDDIVPQQEIYRKIINQ